MSSAVPLRPGLALCRAPNPSPMTKDGTNTYLLGRDRCVLIDPGPEDDAHLKAILASLAGRPLDLILVTHSHVDHSRLAPRLSDATGAPVAAFGDSTAGRSAAMETLAAASDIAGGEGVDAGFRPDRLIADAERIDTDVGPLTALHTPGHFGNHLSFDWSGALFTGDLAMGWASSLVSPPDGDVGDFLASCERLRALGPRVLYPGHGAPVDDGPGRLTWLIEHRRAREAQVLDTLSHGPATAAAIAKAIYTDTPTALLPAAERNVLAHLIELNRQARVKTPGTVAVNAAFSIT